MLKATHTCVFAFSSDNREEKLFWIFSGILQGCPLSGSSFVLAINPLLIALEGILLHRKQSVVTACADYIRIVLQEVRSAPRAGELLVVSENISVLQLKAAECVIVSAATSEIAGFQNAAATLLADICPS